jgi:hypothetical protein
MDASAKSPHGGDLQDTLLSWGYNDNTDVVQKIADKECNMDSASGHMLKKTFDELGMTTKSKSESGPNECFQTEHYDSPAVILKEDDTRPDKANQYYKAPCGAELRITGAEHTVGVNAQSGAVFALDTKSPAKAARSLWGRAGDCGRTATLSIVFRYLVGFLEPRSCWECSTHQVLLHHHDCQHRNEQTYQTSFANSHTAVRRRGRLAGR